MIITIDGTTIDTDKRDKIVYKEGGMICKIAPWNYSGCPLTLGITICKDGSILHRGWDWNGDGNHYLHTNEADTCVQPTPEMAETIAGLFSGRILVDGLKIPVGASVQHVCPIDVKAEEKRTGSTIYLA